MMTTVPKEPGGNMLSTSRKRVLFPSVDGLGVQTEAYFFLSPFLGTWLMGKFILHVYNIDHGFSFSCLLIGLGRERRKENFDLKIK